MIGERGAGEPCKLRYGELTAALDTAVGASYRFDGALARE